MRSEVIVVTTYIYSELLLEAGERPIGSERALVEIMDQCPDVNGKKGANLNWQLSANCLGTVSRLAEVITYTTDGIQDGIQVGIQ